MINVNFFLDHDFGWMKVEKLDKVISKTVDRMNKLEEGLGRIDQLEQGLKRLEDKEMNFNNPRYL